MPDMGDTVKQRALDLRRFADRQGQMNVLTTPTETIDHAGKTLCDGWPLNR